MGAKNGIRPRTEYEASMKQTAAVPKRLTLVLKKVKKPPSRPERYSCSLCGKSFSTDKALCGHMRCHPDRTWRGCAPPPPAPNAYLLSPRSGSSELEDCHRSSSSTLSGAESLDSDLSKSLPRWSRKGKRGGKGAVSPSPSSSIPATSEVVEIDPVLESVRGLLLLAANLDPQSSTAVLGDGGAATLLNKHKTVEASNGEALPLKYSCEVYDKRFARPQSLGTHRRTHSFRGWGIKDHGTVVKYASDACCCCKGKLMFSQNEDHDHHQIVENGETSSKMLPFDLNKIPTFEDYGYQFCTTS